MKKYANIYRVLIGLIIGLLTGTIGGAVILGTIGWLSDASGDEPKWLFFGAYLGAKLGLIFGGMIGLVIAAIISVRAARR